MCVAPHNAKAVVAGLQAASRSPDGAWRGTHLNRIQTYTGCGVIAPGRRRAARTGGVVIGGYGYAPTAAVVA